ncbi:MAG: DUF1385 domain-containing protein [Ruminococcaceae bacterium]|nr:DUF1385 domain-containing protein [Oscillospiraceae bacterium]
MSDKNCSCKNKEKNPRLGKVGGQAVLEGIMMRAGDNTSLAVRKEDGSIAVENGTFTSVRKKHKILNIPIIRGCVNMVEMFTLSYSTLEQSAKMLGLDEFEEETKFDKWLKEKLGDKLMNVVMSVAAVLGVALAFGLFTFLPALITKWLNSLVEGGLGWWQNLISGGVRITIFVAYMMLVSLMKEIRTTFEYHGAEHKSIACYEAGEELTPENAKKYTRFHPRCGTSFIFVVLIISILIFSIVKWEMNVFAMVALRLCLLPVVVGISFEFLMIAGKHQNFITKILSAPGLLMQRITTKEPSLDQLEVAIKALKCAMPDEFPEELIENSEESTEEAEESENSAENTEEAETAENTETENDG